MLLNGSVFNFYTRHMLIFKSPSVIDSFNTYIQPVGVNISERKSGTEQPKKRKKRELVFFPPLGGAIGTVVHSLDATRILPDIR